jgi:hypothetical protein
MIFFCCFLGFVGRIQLKGIALEQHTLSLLALAIPMTTVPRTGWPSIGMLCTNNGPSCFVEN